MKSARGLASASLLFLGVDSEKEREIRRTALGVEVEGEGDAGGDSLPVGNVNRCDGLSEALGFRLDVLRGQ